MGIYYDPPDPVDAQEEALLDAADAALCIHGRVACDECDAEAAEAREAAA